MSRFWQNWMVVWCLAMALFGMTLAGGAFAATSGPARILISSLNGPGEFRLDPHLRFSLVVLGAVTIGWSLSLLAATRAANQLGKQRGRPVWTLVTLSVVSWWLIDSVLSIAVGFGLNVVPNTLFLVAYLLPVLRSDVLTSKVSSTAVRT